MNISPLLNMHDIIDLDSSSNPTDVQQIPSSPSSSSNSSSSSNVSGSFQHLSAEIITANLKFNKKD